MTNNTISIDFNGVITILDANTSLIRLTCPNAVVVDTTFHNTTDDSNYQVPVGKKSRIIYIENVDSNDVQNQWGYADDADGNTNAVSLVQPGSTTGLINIIFLSASIPAQKFVNFLRTAGQTANEQIIYIIEEDA